MNAILLCQVVVCALYLKSIFIILKNDGNNKTMDNNIFFTNKEHFIAVHTDMLAKDHKSQKGNLTPWESGCTFLICFHQNFDLFKKTP